MPYRNKLAVLFIMLLGSTAAFASQTSDKTVYTTISAEDLFAIAEDAGFDPVADVDDVDDPMLDLEMNGDSVSIYTDGCRNHTHCRSLQIRSGYAMDVKPTAEQINSWNAARSWSRAYLDDENDPILEADFSFAGGVTRKAVVKWIQRFEESLEEYSDFLDEIMEEGN